MINELSERRIRASSLSFPRSVGRTAIIVFPDRVAVMTIISSSLDRPEQLPATVDLRSIEHLVSWCTGVVKPVHESPAVH